MHRNYNALLRCAPPYYYNPNTGEISWTKPKSCQIDFDASKEAEFNGLATKDGVIVEPEMQHVSVDDDIKDEVDDLNITKGPPSAEALNEGWTEIDHPSPAGNQGGNDPLLSSGDGNNYVLPKGWVDAKDPIAILQEQEHQDENYTEVEWVEVTDPALGNKYFVASQ